MSRPARPIEVEKNTPRKQVASPQRARNTAIRRVYIGGLLAALSLVSLIFLADSIVAVTAPFQIEDSEGAILYQVSQIAPLSSAYKPLDQYPYFFLNYPPVYHLATRIIDVAIGDLVTAGRSVSFVSGLLIELILGALVFFSLPRRVDPVARYGAAVFAGLLPSAVPVMRWIRFARVDTLAVLLAIAGLALFVLCQKHKWADYGAFFLFVAAVFTKQTMVAAPLACFVTLMILDVRRALKAAAFAIALGSAALTGLYLATDGEAFKQLFAYNNNTFSLIRMTRVQESNFSLVMPLVVLAAGVAGASAIKAWSLYRNGRWERVRLFLKNEPLFRLSAVWSLLLLFAFLVSFTSGNVGSSDNYFLELDLACCPLVGLGLWRTLLALRRPMRWTAANVSLLLLPGIILIPALPHAFGGTRVFVHGLSEYSGALEKEDAKAKIAAHREALEFVRNSPGPVFSEDMLLLVQAGKEVPAEPSTVVELARHSQWDETPFVQMINEKRFSAIVVTSSLDNSARFSPAVAQAIRQTYEQSLHIGSEYRILLPRGQE